MRPLYAITVLVLVSLLTGCARAEFTFSDSTQATSSATIGSQVCGPSEGDSAIGSRQGLAGRIFYLEDSQPRYTSVDDYITHGTDAGVDLYMNRLNVPTLRFDQGFLNPQTGLPLKKASGAVLTEYFGFELETELSLQDGDSDGYYQLALLSDDGATLNTHPSTGASTMLVNNDGTHGTKMGCSSQAILMKKGQTVPVRVRYYQGPRYHVALMMMWRKVAMQSSALDPECTVAASNDRYFDTTVTPSVAQAAYTNLLSSSHPGGNWKVLATPNFVLPANKSANPCSVKNPL